MTASTSCSSIISNASRTVAMDFYEALNCPTSLGLYLCLVHGDDVSACTHDIDPLQYEDEEDFAMSYLAASFLSKWSEGPSSRKAELRRKALEKFWLCETRLKDADAGLRRSISGLVPGVSEILYLTREKILDILGPITEAFRVDDCSFGPGSSSSIPRRRAHPSNKFVAADVSSG